MTAVADRLPDTPRPAHRPRWPGALAVCVPTYLLGAHSAWYGPWIVDDAGLTFAYARSIATGAGPVLQPGADPVEGWSNPIWLAVLVLGRRLGLFDTGAWFGLSDLVLFPKAVALLCAAAMFGCFLAVARAVTRCPVLVALVAGCAVAAVPSFAIWTTSGLENGLYALVVVGLATVLVRAAVAGRLLERRTAVACGLLAAAAALTRPDGLVYAVAFPLVLVLVSGRDGLRAAAASTVAFAVPTGSYLAWRLVTFGDYLPATARAKEQGLPTVTDLARPAELIGYTGWLTTVLAVAVVATAVTRPAPTRTAVAMLLVPLGLAVAAYAVLAGDWMAQHRFATPVWPLAALALALSAVHVLGEASARTRVIAAAAVVAAGATTLLGWTAAAQDFRRHPTAIMCFVAQNVGQAADGSADALGMRAGTLLAVDGGGTSLVTRQRFVDLSGLTDATIARFWAADDMAGLREHVFERVRPTFITLWDHWWDLRRTGLLDDPRLERDYELIVTTPGGQREWVRRDAVPGPAALADARRRADDRAALLGRLYPADGPLAWSCGTTIRPSALSGPVT